MKGIAIKMRISMHSILIIAGPLLVLTMLAGCQQVSREAAFSDVQSNVTQRMKKNIQWNRKAGEGNEPVRELLAKELTADDAVQIALLNNRNLQAVFEDIGIAQADVMQAGRIKNPRLDAVVRPFVPSGAATTAGLGLAQNFLELVFLPVRKKLAAAQFEATKARVTVEVLRLTSKTQRAFFELQGAEQTLELRRSVLAATEASSYAAERLRAAGNITVLELNRERDQCDQAKLDLSQAESAIVEKREILNQLMGLWGPEAAEWKMANHLPDMPAEEVDLKDIEKLAIERSAELEASRRDVEALGRNYGLVNISATLSSVEVGVSADRDDDTLWRVGPSLSLEIPIFDQGGARRAKAQSEVHKALEQHAALAVDLRASARTLGARLGQARAQSIFLRDQVLPRRQEILDDTQKLYNGMQLGVFELLQAKRDQIDAGRQYIERLRDYWLARSDVDLLEAGFSNFNRDFNPTTRN